MRKLFPFIVLVALLLGAMPAWGQGKSANAQSRDRKNADVVGDVNGVNGQRLTINDRKAGNTEVTVDGDTQIIGKGNRPVKLGSLKVRDLIAVVSSDSGKLASGGGNVRIKKIFVKEASESATSRRRAVSGVITGINGSELTVSHLIQRDRTFKVLMDANTQIHTSNKNSSGSATPTASGSATLAVGMRVAAVGNLVDGGGILAKIIHVIPGNATGAFKKNPVSTPSGSLSVTPVATGSGTPTPGTLSPTATPTASLSPTNTPTQSPSATPTP